VTPTPTTTASPEASPGCRTKTLVAAETTATTALANTNATRWIDFDVVEHTREDFGQDKRGRPNTGTRYRKTITTSFSIRWRTNETLIAREAASDGCIPLISNDTLLDDAELALLVQALIERHLRAAMAHAGLTQPSLYPEDCSCAAPTTTRILEIFTGLARHHLRNADGQPVQTFQPELNDLQTQVLELLDIPTSLYTQTP